MDRPSIYTALFMRALELNGIHKACLTRVWPYARGAQLELKTGFFKHDVLHEFEHKFGACPVHTLEHTAGIALCSR